MDLEQVKAESARLGMWAHVATVGADGNPDVSPVHPCWEGDVLWTMTGRNTVKARNVAVNPNVAVHWQVGEDTDMDSLVLWGTAEVHDDLETKRRLWTGVFDYDLNMFAPGGPDGSPDVVFMAIRPARALVLRMYGAKGRDTWSAS